MSDVSIPQKRCTKCGQVFPKTIEYFRLRCQGKYYRSECRDCEYQHKLRSQKRNRESANERTRRYREQYPEKDHEYYLAHKDDIKVRALRWNQSNRTKRNARLRKNYAERSGVREKRQRYYQGHKSQARIHRRQRRMRERLGGQRASTVEIKALYEQQDGRCGYCGIPIFWDIAGDIHIDHIQPIAKGGGNDIGNLLCTCADCNLSKHEKIFDEWQLLRLW